MMALKPTATINSDTPFAQAIVDTMREPLLVLEAELRVVPASRAFCRVFNAGRPVATGSAFHTLCEGQLLARNGAIGRRNHCGLPRHRGTAM
jgi:chemotaxis protein methyltransferase CheR